jgi:alpha-tubulin suppressor-like RCC1 family protein
MCTLDKAKNALCDSHWSFLKEPRPLKIGAVKWASGSTSGTALLPSGQVVAWQRDWSKPDAVLKQNISGLADAVAIAGESSVVCAVRKSGKVACVGMGYRLFDKKEPLKPAAAVEVPDVTDATAIVGGSGDMCVLRKSGDVACFSSFRIPQPVDPKQKKVDAPKPAPIEVRPVKGLANVAAISANGSTRCALLKDGTASCWGSNSYGQLGTGDYDFRWDATPVRGLTDVAQIAAGPNHTCALKKSGEVLCWGRNMSDEAGQSAPPYAHAPVPVSLPKP